MLKLVLYTVSTIIEKNVFNFFTKKKMSSEHL